MKKITLFIFIILFSSINILYSGPSNPRVLIETNFGNITIELNRRSAPGTTRNFLKYAKSGFYNGTIFHRVIKGFMIQGGGIKIGMKKKPVTAPIRNEAYNGLKNYKYTIAMARTGDPHSATAQFFINTNNNYSLNYRSRTPGGWGYCVFGKVIRGKKVVDTIENQKTTSMAMYQNVPVTIVLIKRIRIVK